MAEIWSGAHKAYGLEQQDDIARTNHVSSDMRSGTKWEEITDLAERRRLQNRIAQRNYRKVLKKRLAKLEESAGSVDLGHNRSSHKSLHQNETVVDDHARTDLGSTDPSINQFDPEVMAYQDSEEPVYINCICNNTSDNRFVIACLKCGRWQHIACYYVSAKEYVDQHQCVQCTPRRVNPKISSSKRVTHEAISFDWSGTEYKSSWRSNIGAGSSIRRCEPDESVSVTTESEACQPDSSSGSDQDYDQRFVPRRMLTSPFNQFSLGSDTTANFDQSELKRVKEINVEKGKTMYIIPCPLAAVEIDIGLPRTCGDVQLRNFSQIRRHLRLKHAKFIKGCNVCQQEILDPEVFAQYHGIHCTDRRPKRGGIAVLRQHWKELYIDLRHDSQSNDSTVWIDCSPAQNANSILEDAEEEGIIGSECGAAYSDTEMICECSSEMSLIANPDSTERHALTEFGKNVPSAWRQVQDNLPDSYKWDTEYVTTHSESGNGHGCWTCTPLQVDEPKQIPLTIAGAAVVLPVDHQWPPMGGVNPPPDPRPSALIDCRSEMSLDVIRDLFLTFEGSVGFYVLVNGLLQIIVSDDFDTSWASSHLPHKFGGLKVCYIKNTMEPTMLSSNVATTSRTAPSSTHSQGSRLLNVFRQSQSTQSLQLNDSIEARVALSSGKFSGRIGLKVSKAGQTYLVMSSHVITEAILGRSFLGLNRDPLRRLREDWNNHAEIWAGNMKIGTIAERFDRDAEYYPTRFRHDVTLIQPSVAASLENIKSPVENLGWLRRDAWSSLRQHSSSIKILGPTETSRQAKCMRCHLPSEASIVGEGVFLNQTEAAGARALGNHDASTWSELIARAVLYRVSPDFDPPTGYSGIALYADGTREDGTYGPGIVGFQSFVQRSGHTQNFNIPEGPAMEERLRRGRIAFYGAFQVPDKLRTEYDIL